MGKRKTEGGYRGIKYKGIVRVKQRENVKKESLRKVKIVRVREREKKREERERGIVWRGERERQTGIEKYRRIVRVGERKTERETVQKDCEYMRERETERKKTEKDRHDGFNQRRSQMIVQKCFFFSGTRLSAQTVSLLTFLIDPITPLWFLCQ